MKAICVINTSGNYGGAEKRMVSLFGHVKDESDDIMLLINRSLYDMMIEKIILSSGPEILIIDIPFDKYSFPDKNKTSREPQKDQKQNTLKNHLGRYKYFIKTFYQWIVFSSKLTRILKKNKIKIVYTIWQGGIWGRITFKRMGVKVIYGANSNLVWHLEKGLLYRFDSQYRILREADHVDFLSKGLVTELKTLMPEKDFPKSYSISPCSFIDYTNFYPENPKENIVVFMGRLVSLKKPLLFLEAVTIFNSTYSNSKEVKFLILGTGTEEGAMKQFVKEHNLSNVIFKGKVSRPEKYLQRSKIFISIQQTENYPSQALMEAMACENAVIASDVGETRKIVTENEGVLVELDANKIAKALIFLFSNPDTLQAKGRSARKKVMQEHTISRFKEYFYQLMD